MAHELVEAQAQIHGLERWEVLRQPVNPLGIGPLGLVQIHAVMNIRCGSRGGDEVTAPGHVCGDVLEELRQIARGDVFQDLPHGDQMELGGLLA